MKTIKLEHSEIVMAVKVFIMISLLFLNIYLFVHSKPFFDSFWVFGSAIIVVVLISLIMKFDEIEFGDQITFRGKFRCLHFKYCDMVDYSGHTIKTFSKKISLRPYSNRRDVIHELEERIEAGVIDIRQIRNELKIVERNRKRYLPVIIVFGLITNYFFEKSFEGYDTAIKWVVFLAFAYVTDYITTRFLLWRGKKKSELAGTADLV